MNPTRMASVNKRLPPRPSFLPPVPPPMAAAAAQNGEDEDEDTNSNGIEGHRQFGDQLTVLLIQCCT